MVKIANCDKLAFQIADLSMKVQFVENQLLRSYIGKEFNLSFLYEGDGEADIEVNIYFGSRQKNDYLQTAGDMKKATKGQWMEDILVARGRHLEYTALLSEKSLAVSLYIPYEAKGSFLERFMSPCYLEKWQRCLIDFFHGPFLCLLQLVLMNHGKTFIHGSSFELKGQGRVLTSNAQTGKTLAIEHFNKIQNIKIYSEDFTIIGKDSLYAYPKQMRIYYKQMKRGYYSKNPFEYPFEKLAFLIFEQLSKLGIESKRILDYSVLFSPEKLRSEGQLSTFYFLKRDGASEQVDLIDIDKANDLTVENLKSEFMNIEGTENIFKNIYGDLSYEGFETQLRQVLRGIYQDKKLLAVNLPFYETKLMFGEQLERIINHYD